MPEVSATDAARRFFDLLAVAHIEPITRGRSADVKALLCEHSPDRSWANQLSDLRELLEVDERS